MKPKRQLEEVQGAGTEPKDRSAQVRAVSAGERDSGVCVCVCVCVCAVSAGERDSGVCVCDVTLRL